MRSRAGTTDVEDVAGAYAANEVCRRVAADTDFAAAVRADPVAALAGIDLPAPHRQALLAGDVAALYRVGVHPVLLARLAVAQVFGVTEADYPRAIRGA